MQKLFTFIALFILSLISLVASEPINLSFGFKMAEIQMDFEENSEEPSEGIAGKPYARARSSSNACSELTKKTLKINHFEPKTQVIREIWQMDEILTIVDQKSLVLFDVDRTLILPGSPFLDSKVRTKSYESQLEIIFAKKMELLEKLYEKATIVCSPKLIEASIPKIILELQRRKILTLAFTSRAEADTWDPNNHDIQTVHQLKKVGIDFSSSMQNRLKLSSLTFSEGPPPSVYKGIIFTAREEKGPILVQFLEALKLKPQKIVFIDDQRECLESVQKALEKKGIPSICFHYRGADKIQSTLDPKIANLQLLYLLVNDEWLNEEKAQTLLEVNK